ncbi:hypothetical protein, partial [Neisseria gonorrhoeae]|uniref:hypothetical protein n=1 Tax=Neisseria gonorrhoeae TaxID=485 RepID=UPI001461545F
MSTNDGEQRDLKHEQHDVVVFLLVDDEFEQFAHNVGNEHHEHDRLDCSDPIRRRRQAHPGDADLDQDHVERGEDH